ncbi:hypothetical protein [Amycolatopsis sp. YIM 10]|uniref:hypothetical protein n=1 Tax=Amycolatopsis sp. YIM 10 TaxID=2653857 RepID=UPI001290788E|nr:hypothetical protein [Amycolatopsis sp. YIM 10]QFU89817.1 hypothetical protein YIM_23200 [Amycolatopsis sp. YIM 10]
MSAKGTVTLIAAIIVVITALAVWDIQSYPDPPSGDTTPSVPDLPATPCPESTAEPARFPNDVSEIAAPYAGQGPHPVYGSFESYDEGVAGRVLSRKGDDTDWPDLPDGWLALSASSPTVRLVLCEYVVGIGSDRVDTCEYAAPRYTAPVYEAKYRFLLYEAKTAHEVTRFDLDGTKVSCDDNVPYQKEDGAGFVVAKRVDGAALTERLRPFVEPAR